MSHENLERLIQEVQLSLPGVLEDAVKVVFYSVLDEFIKHTNVWTEEVEFEVEPGNKLYEIYPEMGEVHRLLGVKNSSSMPVRASMSFPGMISLSYEPSSQQIYTANVVLALTGRTTSKGWPWIRDWIVNRYLGALKDGVLGNMMSQPAKPYSDERKAVYHLRRYRDQMAEAKVEAKQEYTYRKQDWKFPRGTM